MKSQKDYRAGVIILDAHSDDKELIAALKQGESPFRKILLEQSMRDLLNCTAKEAPTPVATQQVPTVQVVKPKATNKKRTDDPYKHKWQPLYTELNFLRHTLRETEDIAERGAKAHRICDLVEECYYYWGLRDYYQEHGIEKKDDRAIDITTDKTKLHKELTNVRSYVTKYRAKVKHEPHNNRAKKNLAKWEIRKAELEEILDVQPNNRHIKYNKQTKGTGAKLQP